MLKRSSLSHREAEQHNKNREKKASMANSYSKSSITHLTQDHIFSILHLLPINSIISFSMTCKKFRALASSDSLWESFCRRDFGSSYLHRFLADYATEGKYISWKKLYQQIYQLGSVSCTRLFGEDGISPGPRASHSLNFISDSLVLFGGGSEGGCHLDDTWVAYTGSDFPTILRWKQINSGIPTGRFGHTCNIIGDKLVLFGGINDNGIRQNDTWVGHVLHSENTDIQLSWRPLDVGPAAPPPRGAHAGCCIGDKMMVIHGGIGLDGLRLDDTWWLDFTNDRGSGSWHEIVTPRSPPARSGHTLTWIGGTNMILFGGRGTGYEVLNDIWLFDMGREYPEWEELIYDASSTTDGVPLPRVGHSATLILGDQVLIYGGEDSLRHRKDDMWVLDPGAIPAIKARSHMLNLKRLSGKMWKRLKVEGHHPICRSFHRACADQSGQRVYVFGGMVDGVRQPAESFGLRFNGELYLVELLLEL